LGDIKYGLTVSRMVPGRIRALQGLG